MRVVFYLFNKQHTFMVVERERLTLAEPLHYTGQSSTQTLGVGLARGVLASGLTGCLALHNLLDALCLSHTVFSTRGECSCLAPLLRGLK